MNWVYCFFRQLPLASATWINEPETTLTVDETEHPVGVSDVLLVRSQKAVIRGALSHNVLYIFPDGLQDKQYIYYFAISISRWITARCFFFRRGSTFLRCSLILLLL